MKTQIEFVVLVFLVTIGVSQGSLWSQEFTELDVYLQGFTIESSKVGSIIECYAKCEEDVRCYSINMNPGDKTCELKSTTKVRHPEKVVKRENVIYMEIREHIEPGENPEHPISSCKSLNGSSGAKSGVYWMRFKAALKPVQVYCEMETDGGGWTLVYSYGFTKYNSFSFSSNAVTPMPNWPLIDYGKYKYTPISTTIPLNKTAHSAMDFSLWKLIGSEVLAASNINDWFSCTDGGNKLPKGSFVYWITGSMTCKRVKEIVPRSTFTCTPAIPNFFRISSCSPQLRSNDNQIYSWDSLTESCYPCHDPCGTITTSSQYLRNVANPGGQIYIR